MKNLYGVTPWGRWFIDVLDSYKMGERLERGRRYANSGKVLSLDINAGRASAKVEGKSSPFYKVSISFPPLEKAEKVYKLIESDPPLMARIASGELPETFLQKLKSEGINLTPVRWREMKRSCSCPDYGDPCKHMAALYYIIAREIDANPQVLFRLRGMDLGDRFGKSAVHKIAPPFAITYANVKDSDFPRAQESPQPFELEPIPYCAELITSLLPPNPPFCNRDFSSVIAEFYHRCAGSSLSDSAHWESAYSDTETMEQTEHDFSRSNWKAHFPGFSGNIPEPGMEPYLQAQDINGGVKRYTLFEAFSLFSQFSSDDGTASYNFLFYLFKFLNLVCLSGAFIPYVYVSRDLQPSYKDEFEEDDQADIETLKIIWRPYENLPQVSNMLKLIASRECEIFESANVFHITLADKQRKQRSQLSQLSQLSQRSQHEGRKTISAQSAADILSSAFLGEWVRKNFMQFKNDFYREDNNTQNNDYKKLLNMFFTGMFIDITPPAKRSLPMTIDRWLSVLHIDFTAYRYEITIKELIKRKSEDQAEQHAESGSLFNADDILDFTVSMDVITAADDDQAAVKTPLSKCKDIEKLRAPVALSNYLPEIKELFTSRKVALSETRLVTFLDCASSLLTRLGMIVNLPKTLARELKPRLVVKGKTDSLVHYLDLNALQDFEWQVAVGGDVMSIKEFEKLVKLKKAIVRFRDGFVKMQAGEFSHLLKKARASSPGVNDFLKAHFTGDTVLPFNVKKNIDNIFKEHDFPVPSELNAQLRPYQVRGYNWICSLLLSGFGCILADDMGLGKTIQSIALILRLKKEGLLADGCLIVAPAALLNNWEKEFGRFAPSIKVSLYHGSGRRFDKKSDAFLTTYQTTVRDAEKLNKRKFSLLLADEAHLMKNSQTRVSRTVKNLQSKYRLALSGTPVENRLEDLRSLFDFILPGYLGDAKNFRENYRVPIEVMRNKDQAEALQKITSPFLLRRLKTDKNIIRDLPEKIVTNEYAVLEKEQAALYETVVEQSMQKAKEISSKERTSLIFYLLTSLKQICNHPRAYDGESPPLAQLSGKAQLLVELLQKILANREKVLVFSQYVETLDCLSRIIKKELGEAALIYHGGLNQNTRTMTINRFQDDPGSRIMLISLKAGGLGLNLTAASRVIHYDLWYNPAVENQATDRAFRIGQKRTVFVHRLITKNSFEEKIDAMISSKKELADMTVKSGESWLARMSHEELKKLFER